MLQIPNNAAIPVVVETVNFIRALGLNHYRYFLAELNAEYQDLIYYCEVRERSRGAMLPRVYNL